MLVYLYYKHRKKAASSDRPPGVFAEDQLPSITVQLPIFNEQFVIDRLVEASTKMQYPREKLRNPGPRRLHRRDRQVARAIVERYAALGHNIAYIHRDNRQGFKAGAFEEGMPNPTASSSPSSTPTCPAGRLAHARDPSLHRSRVGMVQTRWTHLNRNYSFLTEVEAILLDGHFVLEHGGRSRAGVFFNFNGTAGMWRRKAIDDAGGWEHDTLTEDTDLSYRSQLAGWKFEYLQDVECPAELPIEMTAFKTQQARWAKGLIQVARRSCHGIPQQVPRRVKTGSLVSPDRQHQLSADDRAVSAAAAGHDDPLLPGLVPDAVHRPAAVSGIHFLHLELLSGLAKRAVPRKWWLKTFLYLPFLMALGIGLTVTNTKAVMEALLGIKSAFTRTPKYRVESKSQMQRPLRKNIAVGLACIPWIELLSALTSR